MSFSADEVVTTNSAVFIDTQVHFNQPLIDKLWVLQRQCKRTYLCILDCRSCYCNLAPRNNWVSCLWSRVDRTMNIKWLVMRISNRPCPFGSSKCCKSVREVGTYIAGVSPPKVQRTGWIKIPCGKPRRKLLFSHRFTQVRLYLFVFLAVIETIISAVNVTCTLNYKRNGQTAVLPWNFSRSVARKHALFRIIILDTVRWLELDTK